MIEYSVFISERVPSYQSLEFSVRFNFITYRGECEIKLNKYSKFE